MGKGGSRPQQPTEQNIVQSSLPKYFEPYAIDMIKRAEAESKREYTPFQGQRLADENTDTARSREIARGCCRGWYTGAWPSNRRYYSRHGKGYGRSWVLITRF